MDNNSDAVDFFRTALSANDFDLYSDDDLLDVEQGTEQITSILERLLDAHPNPDFAAVIENFKTLTEAYVTAALELQDEEVTTDE